MNDNLSYEKFLQILGLIPSELTSALYELYIKAKLDEVYKDGRNNHIN